MKKWCISCIQSVIHLFCTDFHILFAIVYLFNYILMQLKKIRYVLSPIQKSVNGLKYLSRVSKNTRMHLMICVFGSTDTFSSMSAAHNCAVS